ncbi:cupin domain-containing protein [Horticoccus luteus]|uniref:Cupin domain-containing protein n=1 Tax=Horticoccus luteus TaxID=2862869 RepID=A0A8F9TWD6_9BACT|nr:cupin domain-containing protein [Horticoccus luteus]QYM78782.1 cupin domain-containing protein [Horticoccus luteus]
MNTLLSPTEPGHLSLLAPVATTTHGIVSRAVITTPALRLTLFHFAVGQELSEHTSKARAIVQILTGGCRFTVNGTAHELRAGDLLAMPPRAPHSVFATEAFSMLLTQITEPAATETAAPAATAAPSAR